MTRLVSVAALGLAAALAAPPARADDIVEIGVDACVRGTKWRGHKIDFDVKDASLHDVFRFLSDIGKVNVVVADDVAGKVTMKLRKVPWDQVLCTVAASKQLRVDRDGSVYLVRKRAAARSTAGATTAWSSSAGR
jgi:type II secretory pathway component GspD/PulD (secretin)